jgi:hypothetical protein
MNLLIMLFAMAFSLMAYGAITDNFPLSGLGRAESRLVNGLFCIFIFIFLFVGWILVTQPDSVGNHLVTGLFFAFIFIFLFVGWILGSLPFTYSLPFDDDSSGFAAIKPDGQIERRKQASMRLDRRKQAMRPPKT